MTNDWMPDLLNDATSDDNIAPLGDKAHYSGSPYWTIELPGYGGIVPYRFATPDDAAAGASLLGITNGKIRQCRITDRTSAGDVVEWVPNTDRRI